MLSRPKWRNWQTRRTQNPVPPGECGFDSHLRHCGRWSPALGAVLQNLIAPRGVWVRFPPSASPLFVEPGLEAGPGVVLGLRRLLVAVGDRRLDLRLGVGPLRL